MTRAQFEPTTPRSHERCSNHWATKAITVEWVEYYLQRKHWLPDKTEQISLNSLLFEGFSEKRVLKIFGWNWTLPKQLQVWDAGLFGCVKQCPVFLFFAGFYFVFWTWHMPRDSFPSGICLFNAKQKKWFKVLLKRNFHIWDFCIILYFRTGWSSWANLFWPKRNGKCLIGFIVVWNKMFPLFSVQQTDAARKADLFVCVVSWKWGKV